MGRPRKTPEEHKRDGTFRADRHADQPPTRRNPGRPPMPPNLTASMKTAWRRIIEDLEAAAMLDKTDASIIEFAARLWGRAREASALVNKHGLLIAGERGMVANPAIRIERDSMALFRQYAEMLGISPRARAALGLALARHAPPPDSGDKGEEKKPRRSSAFDAIGEPKLTVVDGGGEEPKPKRASSRRKT